MNENEIEVIEENEAMESEVEQELCPIENQVPTISDESDSGSGSGLFMVLGGLVLGGLTYAGIKLAPKIKKGCGTIKNKIVQNREEKIKKYVAEHQDLENDIVIARAERSAVEAAPEEANDVEIKEVDTEEK